MGIRAKILSGFMILAVMLLIAGSWSIYELRNIGMSVQKLLDENYKSIDAAKTMIEALERQDSAVLLMLLGNRNDGLAIIQAADESFQKAYAVAHSNITIPGEQGYIDAVATSYDAFKALWLQQVAGAGGKGDMKWYVGEVQPSFLKAKIAVSDLMKLNHETMYKTASNVESRAYRATMPGIIAIVSAFIFALIFSFLINLFIIHPIIKLTSGIQAYLERRKPLEIKVLTDDEILTLVSSVKQLMSKTNP